MVEPIGCPAIADQTERGSGGHIPRCVQHTDMYGTRKCRYYLNTRAGWDTTLVTVPQDQARSAAQRADGHSIGCYVACGVATDDQPRPGC